jgi:hypothetical protein
MSYLLKFYSLHDKYQEAENNSLTWFAKSLDVVGIDREICRLFTKKYRRMALVTLDEALTALHDGIERMEDNG